MIAQFFHRITFDDPAHNEIDKQPGIMISSDNLFRKAALFAYRLFFLKFSGIDYAPVIKAHGKFQPVIDFQRVYKIPGLDNKIEFLGMQISLDCITPALIPDFQEIRKDMHMDVLPYFIDSSLLISSRSKISFGS